MLAHYEGDLIAAGGFVSIGGQSASHIARWDGTSWRPFGAGVDFAVTAVAEYAGHLIAAGAPGASTHCIASWDGAAWLYLPAVTGAGTVVGINALAVSGPDLYAAGDFSAAGGVPASLIARWDGAQWNPLDTGLVLPSVSYGAFPPGVQMLVTQGPAVLAGGSFFQAGGRSAPFLARWEPSPPACYPNCDCSQSPPLLNIADFACFISKFASSDPYANCDGSSTQPTLNVLDFICFLNRFAAGCP